MTNKHVAGSGKHILHQILEHTFQIGTLQRPQFSGTIEQPAKHFHRNRIDQCVHVDIIHIKNNRNGVLTFDL
jgi:hypothetical protein